MCVLESLCSSGKLNIYLNIYFSCFHVPAFVSVSDGEHTTPELDFAILLLSNHQQPPVFQVLDPLLEVSVGGQAAVGKRKIHAHSKKKKNSNTNFKEERLW